MSRPADTEVIGLVVLRQSELGGIRPLTRRYAPVDLVFLSGGFTRTTSLRAVRLPSRVMLAMTGLDCRTYESGPEMCRFTFTRGCSLMRVPFR